MGNSESLQLNANPRHSVGPGSPQLTYNGHRISRRYEDDYVDISPELESISKEQMEDQFVQIVVGQLVQYDSSAGTV